MNTPSGPDDRTQDELFNRLWNGTFEEQRDALLRLASVGQAEALDAVVTYLCDPSAEAPDAALSTLRVLANKYLPAERYSLTEAILPFLASEDWGQRLTAVRLLNTHPNELALEPLRTLVYEMRDFLAQATGPHRSEGAWALAERILSEAIMALATVGRVYVLPDIFDLMEVPSLRPVATRALGMVGSETERDHLEDLIEDRDPSVRDAAQWALTRMDERAEQFLNPPPEPVEPPPGRLNPIYWIHRLLQASSNDLIQFLVVRVAIEHLILDQFLYEGRVPEACTIVLRAYEGSVPPNHKTNNAPVVGAWQYSWHGPSLRRKPRPTGSIPGPAPRLAPLAGGALITVSYPRTLPTSGDGLVSFDCQFQPFFGQGWIYRVSGCDGDWTFSLVRRTWAT